MDFENFQIFVSNLSSVYVSSVVALLCGAVTLIYFVVNNMHKPEATPEKLDQHSDSEVDEGETTPTKNLIGRLKTAKLKLLEESMTEEQKMAEREIEREQLAAIFKLLKEQEQQSAEPIALDENELQEQLNLYR